MKLHSLALPKYEKSGMAAVCTRVVESMKSDELPERSVIDGWIREARTAPTKQP